MAGGLTNLDFAHHPGGPPEVIGETLVRNVKVETWRFTGSRGDQVLADAYLADGSGPVVIGGHGRENNRKAQYLRGPALQWAGRGVSFVSADAPLHGDRAGEAPVPAVTIGDPDLLTRWVKDQRLLCHLLAEDDRLRGGILVVGGSSVVSVPERFDDVDDELTGRLMLTDPELAAARIAPRPVLMLNADDDEVFSRRSALALYDALGHPKEISFFPGRHARWRNPRQWNRRMWYFLEDTCSDADRS